MRRVLAILLALTMMLSRRLGRRPRSHARYAGGN